MLDDSKDNPMEARRPDDSTTSCNMDESDLLDAKPPSIRIFSDRSASDLEALEWNASMDLLACLTAPPDSTLSIYRLLSEDSSPKLLSEKITSIGTALAWSPCGRKIAVGDRLGGVAIYDGESGAVLHTRRLHDHPIRALSWVSTGASAETAGEPAWSHMLPPLLSIPTAPTNMFAEALDADVEPKSALDVATGLSLLVSADEAGLVIISAGGTFPLQATQVFAGGVTQPSSPLNHSVNLSGNLSEALQGKKLDTRRLASVRLSPDLRYLAVLLGSPDSAPALGSGLRSPLGELSGLSPVAVSPSDSPMSHSNLKPDSSICQISGDSWSDDELVIVMDVRKLAVRRNELARCSSMAERLLAVVAYTKKAVDTLGQVWRSAADGFSNKMRGLSDAIEAYGDKDGTSIHQELLLTCCMGYPSDAVHAFLTRQTSPQQLARLERGIVQALEYVNLVVCTRLQVASQHILTILHELHACASWTQRYGSIGLGTGPLDQLTAHTRNFLQLTEQLLLECSQARRFVRTLFQVLLRMSQKLSEQPSGAEPGASAPSKEDMDAFIARMQQRHSLGLVEVTGRIMSAENAGTTAAANASKVGAAVSGDAGPVTGSPPPASLASAVQQLSVEAEQVGKRIVESVSAHVAVLACVPVHAPSPWASVAGLTDLRDAACSEAAAGVPSPRGLGGSTLSLTWQTLEPGQGARLILQWSGGGIGGAELHLCRVSLTPAPPGVVPPLRFERARLTVQRQRTQAAPLDAQTGSKPPAHFLLCQMYDAMHTAALVLQERPAGGGAVATVYLVDISELEFQAVPRLGGPGGLGDTDGECSGEAGQAPLLPPATALQDMPEDLVRKSVVLPESYVWASAMRVMSTRGVCSIYARRARRLLTLDMEAAPEEDDENEDDVGN